MQMIKTTIAGFVALAGATVMLVGGGASSASAQAGEGRYNIMINTNNTYFVADYCVLTTTSGNSRAQCSGNKESASKFRMGVVHNPGDRVWLDVNIVAGKDRKGIDLRGTHYITVEGDLSGIDVCGWSSKAAYDDERQGVGLHGDPSCRP
ncbi:hypothetical protein ACQPYK_18680 [Streptosporangium sp. CA-135522]|uniref:hypothetical protein n=1 Tax=Streptosporangium sp. CA-135522 TaxID=3240072 RepID=UPI003D9010D3